MNHKKKTGRQSKVEIICEFAIDETKTCYIITSRYVNMIGGVTSRKQQNHEQ